MDPNNYWQCVAHGGAFGFKESCPQCEADTEKMKKGTWYVMTAEIDRLAGTKTITQTPLSKEQRNAVLDGTAATAMSIAPNYTRWSRGSEHGRLWNCGNAACSSKRPAIASPEWNKSNIPRLNDMVSRELGTPYTVSVERNMMRDTVDVSAHCSTCGMWWTTDLSWAAATTVYIESKARAIADSANHARKGDWQVCRCVEGRTPKDCLRLYQLLQRAHDIYIKEPALLTSNQLAAARTAWSQELKRRVKDSERKARMQVVVDVQDVE